jgi:hypothetical protein
MSEERGGKRAPGPAAGTGAQRSARGAGTRGRAGGPWALGALLAAYLALALAYNLATPVGVSPDELGHAEYIRYLAAHHRLPVFGAPGLAYEAHQPPLFYLLAEPVWAAAGSGPVPAKLPLTEWRHREGQWVLAGRAAAQGRAVRLLTTLIGAVGLALIWALAGVLYPEDCWLRVAATAIAAFLPMRLALAAAVSNDLLIEGLFTASLLLMARMLRHGYTHRRALALGAALGAALLAKSTAVMLLPPALVTLLLVSCGRQTPDARRAGDARRQAPGASPAKAAYPNWRLAPGVRRLILCRLSRLASCLDARLFAAGCARTVGVALVLAGPWLLRNRLLYGDCLAARAFAAYFRAVQTTPAAMMALHGLTPAGYWSQVVGRWTYSSFWGVFGPFTVWMAPRVYQALAIPTVLAPAGIVLRVGRRQAEADTCRRRIWVVLSLAVGLVVFGYVRYNQLIVEPQSRFLFPAMAPIALLAARGWLPFVPRQARPAAAVGVGLGMAALAVYAVAGVIAPYYR